MPEHDEIAAAEETVAKKGFKRITEPVTTALAAAWMAVVAIFNIRRPEVITSVGAAIAAFSYVVSALVDKSRGA